MTYSADAFHHVRINLKNGQCLIARILTIANLDQQWLVTYSPLADRKSGFVRIDQIDHIEILP